MSQIMSRRGKPAAIDHQLMVHTILQHKSEILNNDKIVSATSEVWTKIASELDNKIKPTSLHSYVTNNKFELNTRLLNKVVVNNTESDASFQRDSLNSTTESPNKSINENKKYLIIIPTKTYNKLVVEKMTCVFKMGNGINDGTLR